MIELFGAPNSTFNRHVESAFYLIHLKRKYPVTLQLIGLGEENPAWEWQSAHKDFGDSHPKNQRRWGRTVNVDLRGQAGKCSDL